VDRHRGVAEDRLRPGGRDGDRALGVWLAGRRIDDVVAD
jgi:hypothetical protein